MSATYTTNVGLGIPSLNDTDFVATLAATLNLLDGQAPLKQFSVKVGTGLTVQFSGGTMVKLDGTEVVVAGGSISLTANQTNYLWVDAAGAQQQNTTGLPVGASILPVAAVTCGGSSVTGIVDLRRAYRQSGLAASSAYLAVGGGSLTGLLTLSGTGSGAGLAFSVTAAPGSPADGQVWYDSTKNSLRAQLAGLQQGLPGGMFLQTASATVANTTAETTLIAAGQGATTVPANAFSAGKTVRVRASGFVSTTGSPTAEVKLKLGSAVLTTGAVAVGTGVSNVGFRLDGEFACRTPGASGVFVGQARVEFNGVTYPAVATATSTLDSTGTLALALTLTWSAASASNTATVTNLTVEVLN